MTSVTQSASMFRINHEFTIDILSSVTGHSWGEMRAYIETVNLDRGPLRVLTLEGLLLEKQGAWPKNQLDAAVLRQRWPL